jgi:hypothetical protein
MGKQPTSTLVDESERPAVCTCCRTVPLTRLSLDVETPFGGWPAK